MITKTMITSILLFLLCPVVFGKKYMPEYEKTATRWADSVMATLSLDEKIGQLIMVTAYPSQGDADEKLILSQISRYKIGGILFLKSSPTRLKQLTTNYQKASKIPLFLAIDGENGLSFRMDSVVEYPNLMALGAIKHDSLIYRMGREIGQQFKALGLNMNFSPIADVNSNPMNPIINYRSFGENPARVAEKCLALAKGMQDENIMVFAKHFPGHGDTSTDSHHTLPVVEHNYSRLDTTELVPFRKLVSNGINGIMTAHIHMKAIDKEVIPATMSKKVMQGILRDSLGFRGLIISDAMNMKGITAKLDEGKATVEALKAGVDVVEFIIKPAQVVDAIKKAIQQGELTEAMIDEKCRKVLLSKSWCGLHKKQTEEKSNQRSNAHERTAGMLYRQSLTILENRNGLLPLKRLDTLKIATIAIGETSPTPFQERVSSYLESEHFQLSQQTSPQQVNSMLRELKNYNLVIACLHSNQIAPGKKYGLTDIQITAAEQIMARENAIFIAFTNAYAIKFISGIEKSKATIVAYGNHRLLQDFTAQLVFGSIGANGTLPVSIDHRFKSGDGIATSPIGRLQYTSPEEAGIHSELLERQIDSVINKAIRDRFFPGCQVLLARQGKVYFSKAYGYQTFDSLVQVTSETLYDWASITKIVGPLPLLMKMTEDSLIDLYRPFSEYWPDFKGTNKERITLHDILTHQAGLQPGLHFHAQLLKKDFKYNDRLVQDHPSEKFQVRISPGLYIHNSFKDSVFAKIRDSNLLKKKGYAYSDLGFLLFPKIISEIYGESFEQLLYTLIYKPLGTKALYNPYLKHPVDRCAPTENDYLFRKTTVVGYVHDESAAVLGGVSGNAGLFGSANDLAIIMQMYLQKGYYGAQRCIQEKTVELFAQKQHQGTENRRALGFDKPVSDHRNQSIQKINIAPFASEHSFGHTGFTGTAVWADPKDQVLFIFLSNRTYPNRSTNMVNDNFRVKLQQIMYELQGTFVVPKL